MILESFQLFLTFVFILLIIFHSISPTSHRSSYSILDGPVGTHAHTVLDTMQHLLPLRHSFLIPNHAVALGTLVRMRLFLVPLVGLHDSIPCLLLPQNPGVLVAVRYIGCSSRGNLPYLG